MGNSPSNRKITVTNDEVAGVIKVSDSVIRRLKGEIEQERKKEATQKPTEPDTQTAVVETPKEKEPPAPADTKPVKSAAQLPPKEDVNYESLMEEAHLTALKIRQEKEAEIRRIQEHWKSQLQDLANHYNKLAELTEAEYRGAVEDVERSFAKESHNDVCKEEKERVVKCYLEHKGQPLYCANEVKDFAAAVQKYRVNSLDQPER